ncbi:uncharacterized protein M421DRAFT_93291 [Didymella exigua CBS 183.55]|uniref:Uncharacterized protein n=1 Tax=Didymella exigua CBS 183.55 TaxID=1150837 RepID=A0A6A5RGJ8_9PLEO|nr:uncharacterized protein M421DRAFT_93291 [Didymella exigua CBS 183.55]KAF1927441.1 hypothetical protein M421DRAFT_93291 [Didymella exigua CBS 183.55]
MGAEPVHLQLLGIGSSEGAGRRGCGRLEVAEAAAWSQQPRTTEGAPIQSDGQARGASQCARGRHQPARRGAGSRWIERGEAIRLLLGAAKRAISRTPLHPGRASEAPEEVDIPTEEVVIPADTVVIATDTADIPTHTTHTTHTPTDTTDTTHIPTDTPDIPTDTPDTPTDTPTDTPDTAIMVTTRRGTETPGMAATPASSAKKAAGKRELDALDTPTRVKRQRKTTVELTRTLRSTPRKGSTQEPAEEAVDDTADDTADDATPRPDKPSPLAIRRRSSPHVVVEPAHDAFHTPEPASSEAAFVTPFTSKKGPEGSPTPKAADSATPAAANKARGRPKKAHKDDAPPQAHVRFGSAEPVANKDAADEDEDAADKGKDVADKDEDAADKDEDAADKDKDDSDDDSGDDSGDDSDEAPDMLSTSQAASQAAAAHADTSRALAAQSEKARKKREARLQRLVDEQAAKRKRDALKAQRAAARAKKAARLSAVAEPDDGGDSTRPPVDTDADADMGRATALPSLLPDALLATLGDVRPPTPPPRESAGRTAEDLRRAKLSHHIKFLEQTSRAPKDRRAGKHHVAVLAAQSSALPPKVSRSTKGVREAWLKGRQGSLAKGRPRAGMHRATFGRRPFSSDE